MSGKELYSYQFVVQQLGVGQFSTYRVVVYSDQLSPRHADFQSGQDLLRGLQEAIPEIDWSGISINPMEEGQGSIVFNQQLKLDAGQLKILGLDF